MGHMDSAESVASALAPPACGEHGSLVLALAMGDLDDADALLAETARRSCDSCRTWWEATFRGPDLARLEDAVSAAARAFRPVRPGRAGQGAHPARTLRWSAPLAAALLLGALAASDLLGSAQPTPGANREAAGGATPVTPQARVEAASHAQGAAVTRRSSDLIEGEGFEGVASTLQVRTVSGA